MKCNRCGRELENRFSGDFCLFCGNDLKNNYKTIAKKIDDKAENIKNAIAIDEDLQEDLEEKELQEEINVVQQTNSIDSNKYKKESFKAFVIGTVGFFLPGIIIGLYNGFKYLAESKNPSIEFFGPLPELFISVIYFFMAAASVILIILIVLIGFLFYSLDTKKKKDD